MGANLCGFLKFSGLWGFHVISCIHLTYTCTNIRKYDIKTLTYLFMEDVYSWMRSTHEFQEIEAPQNLMISQ